MRSSRVLAWISPGLTAGSPESPPVIAAAIVEPERRPAASRARDISGRRGQKLVELPREIDRCSVVLVVGTGMRAERTKLLLVTSTLKVTRAIDLKVTASPTSRRSPNLGF